MQKNSITNNLIKIFSREYSVQYTEVALRSLRVEVKQHLPSLVSSQAFIPEQGNEACYVDRNEWARFLDALRRKYVRSQSLRKFFQLFHFYGQTYIKTAKRIAKLPLAQCTEKELAEHYALYQKNIITYCAYLWIGFFLNNIYSEDAKKLLSRRTTDEGVTTALFSPSRRTGVLLLQDVLRRFTRKDGRIPKREIQNILKHYGWLSCLDLQNDPWTERELRQFITTLAPASRQYSFAKASQLACLTKKERAYFELVRELVYVKDMRDEYRRRGVYAILPLFDEIAKRFHLKRHELAYFSSHEISEALRGDASLNRSVAQKRKKGFLIYFKNNQCIVTTDQIAIGQFVKRSVAPVTNRREEKGIVGQIASSGRSEGKARIVLGVRDLVKVKKGDILISITTNPDFVPAMQRAAAIVTDEGGLTSHAAIVAREMKKPCIVGTKIATKIFKDGDRVEVDANSGIVRKI